MRPLNENIIPLQAAATVTTAAVSAIQLLYISAQITAAGGGAGTLKMQASNDDFQPNNSSPVNWSDVPSATVTVTGNGAFLIPKFDLCYQWIRFVYTNSGTGTISVVLKALGA